MDPNANLAEQEAIVIIPYRNRSGHAKTRLLDLRMALSSWLKGGGFEPSWEAYPNAARYYQLAKAYGCAPYAR